MDQNNKMGILTFYNTTNYGALLQMYALYRTLCDGGFDVSVIRYCCDAVEKRENLKLHNAKSVKQFLRILILKLPNANKQKCFREFEKEHFEYSKVIYNENNLNKIKNEYNEVVVGSDQVWNTQLTGNDKGFFLKDADGVKKVSYAASFGVDTIDDETSCEISPLLNKFDAISVREVSGIDIVKKCCGKTPDFVLDPTFLLNSNTWNKLAGEASKPKKPYVLLYLIQNKKQTIEYAKNIAEKNGWDIKYVNISPYHVRGVQNIRSASPVTFLRLIRDASLIITGSYHGLALSVNFSKPVYYELNSKTKNYNTRISSLISTLGMEKCRLEYDCLEVPQLEYDIIQSKVSELRKKSKAILFSMCSGM